MTTRPVGAVGAREGAPVVPDAAVETAAEALHDLEYPVWSATAHADSNRWSWRGDGHGEEHREQFRGQARAALTAAAPALHAVWERQRPITAHVMTSCVDQEQYAEIWNAGYETAVAQGLAGDPTLAGDWLAERDARIERELREKIASEIGQMPTLTVSGEDLHPQAVRFLAARLVRGDGQ